MKMNFREYYQGYGEYGISTLSMIVFPALDSVYSLINTDTGWLAGAVFFLYDACAIPFFISCVWGLGVSAAFKVGLSSMKKNAFFSLLICLMATLLWIIFKFHLSDNNGVLPFSLGLLFVIALVYFIYVYSIINFAKEGASK